MVEEQPVNNPPKIIDIQFFTIGIFGVNLSLVLRITKP